MSRYINRWHFTCHENESTFYYWIYLTCFGKLSAVAPWFIENLKLPTPIACFKIATMKADSCFYWKGQYEIQMFITDIMVQSIPNPIIETVNFKIIFLFLLEHLIECEGYQNKNCGDKFTDTWIQVSMHRLNTIKGQKSTYKLLTVSNFRWYPAMGSKKNLNRKIKVSFFL